MDEMATFLKWFSPHIPFMSPSIHRKPIADQARRSPMKKYSLHSVDTLPKIMIYTTPTSWLCSIRIQIRVLEHLQYIHFDCVQWMRLDDGWEKKDGNAEDVESIHRERFVFFCIIWCAYDIVLYYSQSLERGRNRGKRASPCFRHYSAINAASVAINP